MIPFLALALAADSSSCRFPELPAPWALVRVARGASSEPGRVNVDACLGVRRACRAENLSTLSGGFATWAEYRVRFRIAFDPLFLTTFVDTEIDLPRVSLDFASPFDGSFDFAGSSGGTVVQQDARFVALSFDDPAPGFFTSDFPVFCEATLVAPPAGTANGNVAISTVSVAAGGVVFGFEDELGAGLLTGPPML